MLFDLSWAELMITFESQPVIIVGLQGSDRFMKNELIKKGWWHSGHIACSWVADKFMAYSKRI